MTTLKISFSNLILDNTFQLWSNAPLAVITVIFICIPFILNGYSFADIECRLYAWSEQCEDYLLEYMLTAAGVNTFFCFLTLCFIGFGVVNSRGSSSSKNNIERRLVWQTTIASFLLIVFFGIQAWAVSNYFNSHELYSVLISVSTFVMLFQRYPSVIILFLVR